MTSVIRRWPTLSAGVALAAALLTLWGLRQTSDVYESVGTFVVRPVAEDEGDRIRAAANLSDNEKINGTLTYVIESELLKGRAASSTPDGTLPTGFDVSASVASGTNILSIAVESANPQVALDMARIVGDEAIAYVGEIEDLYELAVLDVPEASESPGTNWFAPLNVLAALAAAAVFGTGAAWAANRVFPRGLRGGRVAPDHFGMDPTEERYTHQRFLAEKSRSDVSGFPFDLAVMEVSVPFYGPDRSVDDVKSPDPTDVAKMARAIWPTLRDYDHLGYISGSESGAFTVILPGRSPGDAHELGSSWEESAIDSMKRTYLTGVKMSVSSCRYVDGDFVGDAAAVDLARHL